MMFEKQSYFKHHNISDYKIMLLDNNNGKQIDEVKNLFNEKLSTELNSKIIYLGSENIGFGAGHNKIFNYAKELSSFDYYLCVNPDGIPHHKMIENLIEFAYKNNDKGVFEAKQFPLEHPKIYDFKTAKTAWCSACCALYPYELFDKLNGFDDLFFMYMEDVDLSWRAKLLSYECYTVENALFSHSVDENNRDINHQTKTMFISAYKLALKYKNSFFIKFCLKKLKKILSKQELSELKLTINDIKKKIHKIKRENFMNFQTGLYFSKARW